MPIASVQWNRSEMEKAEKIMLENFVARQRTLTIRSVVAIDSGSQLAVIYRDMARPHRFQVLLDLMNGERARQNTPSAFVGSSTSALS